MEQDGLTEDLWVRPPPVVQAVDDEGNPVPGVTVGSYLYDGGTLARGAAQTGPDGRASFRWQLSSEPGQQRVKFKTYSGTYPLGEGDIHSYQRCC